MAEASLTPEDTRRLAEGGISREDARRQLRFLRHPPALQHLERPCTAGDGIRRIEAAEHDGLERRFARAEREGRITKFVPASGAATRMFQSLLPFVGRRQETMEAATREHLEKAAAAGDAGARDVLCFADHLSRFAFYEDLRQACRDLDASLAGALHQGDLGFVLRILLGPEALGYAETPKALIPFHSSPEGPRTPLMEHLVEALGYARDEAGVCRLHFTVSEGEEPRFEAQSTAAAHLASIVAGDTVPRFEVSFSIQHPATHTLALGEDGQPFRLGDGSLLLRPGGHGALLRNLHELARDRGGDLVFIKNVDNVVPDGRKGPTLLWKRLLGGYLLSYQERIFGFLKRLAAGEETPAEDEAAEFLVEELRVAPEEIPRGDGRRAYLRQRLHRPIRVCGVVANTGEPGGGPFWVRGGDGTLSRQIVEAAQVAGTPDQQKILSAATHFNPVDLACGVRDYRGRAFDLPRFVDPNTAFVADKDHLGRSLKALERPGLWNGAMAHWHTFFVEVPSETFAPVKTVFDLLRPEHQGG